VELNQLTQQSKSEMDVDAPYSFLEWRQRNAGYTENSYSQYVADWFVAHQHKPIAKKLLTRQKYLYMLDQLQVFFTDEEQQNWYSKINTADEKELLLGIPFFAKKLKNITLYYLKLRKKLKNTKVKYNLIGSKEGLESEIRQRLMEVFTDLNVELVPSLYNSVPSLTSISQTLNVELEELYDDTVYFDRSPTAPLSSYIDILHEPTAELFRTKGLTLSSDSWVFNALGVPDYKDIDTYVATLTGIIFETTDAALYESFIQKFLGEHRLQTTFNSASSILTEYNITLLSGNNYGYFPNGIVDPTIKIDYVLDTIPLSSHVPLFGTASTIIEGADTLFVKVGNKVKGAWLRYRQFDDHQKTLEAHIKPNSVTSFIFPYPGYGLSAEDIEWTGNSLSATYEYDFLSEDYKQSVSNEYWNQVLPEDTIVPLLINNTTLAEKGSVPSKNPNHADQILITNTKPVDVFFSPGVGEIGTWLYKFDKTSIAVTNSLHDTSVTVWPYENILQAEDFPIKFQGYNFENICEPILLQNLNVPFAVAGDTIDNSEKIYKLSRYNDSIANALECCWLSGNTNTNGTNAWISQRGFSGLFSPNTPARFIWTGADNTPLSSVFRFVYHSNDCLFKTEPTTTDPNSCSCKQVYYSPYGHPGETFNKYNSRADYVVVDSTSALDVFDLGSWADSKNESWTTSSEFAWFNTNVKQSWGDGQWVCNNKSIKPFTLKTGKSYVYNRTDSRDGTTYPPYSVNFKLALPSIPNVEWIQAKKTEDQNWVSVDKKAQMQLNPGDFIKWQRKNTTVSYLMSAYDVENTTKNLSSIWATYDSIVVGESLMGSTNVSVPFALELTSNTLNNTQLPTISAGKYLTFTDINKVYWWKFTNTSNPSSTPFYIYESQIASFTPSVTGTYHVALSASFNTNTYITSGGDIIFETKDKYFDHTVIPPIYAIPKYSKAIKPVKFETPTGGFIIEQNLTGWNYNTKSYDYVSPGAKPFWATLHTTKDNNTKNKSVYSWGYNNTFIDGYIPDALPNLSEIQLQYGNIINYKKQGSSFTWHQPISFREFIDTTEWCQITSTEVSYEALSGLYATGFDQNPTATATYSPTNILLSNVIDGHPVEMFYNSMSNHVWALSVAVPTNISNSQINIELLNINPWNVFSNRFYPTIATVPTTSTLYSKKQVGGYFTPERLGASQYINKTFTPVPSAANFNFNTITEDTDIHIGGRGLTKQSQPTVYKWDEDNRWLKEPPTTNKLTGAVKKTLSKTLQSFIPYQASTNQKQAGVNDINDRTSPWGGTNKNEWTDFVHKPISFSGTYNVAAWSEFQISKEHGKQLDQWSQDIYGNQYGLFKSSLSSTYGDVWVRKNNQLISHSSLSLSSIFVPIKDVSVAAYKNLTENGVINIDSFADTLMFQTSGALIFAKIRYDYSTDEITSSLDDIKYISLVNTLSGQNSTITPNQTWYFPETNKIVCSLTTLSSSRIFPEIYELNTKSNELIKQFPNDTSEQTSVNQALSSLTVNQIDTGLLTYNKNLHQFLLTIPGKLVDGKLFIVDIIVDKRQYYTTNNIDIYKKIESISAPYIIDYSLPITTFVGTTFTKAITSTEPLSNILLQTQYSSISAFVLNDHQAVITGTIPLTGFYQIGYSVSNSAGANYFTLLVNSIPLPPTPTPTATPTPTPTPTATPRPTPVPIRVSLVNNVCTGGQYAENVTWFGGDDLCSATKISSDHFAGYLVGQHLYASDGHVHRYGQLQFEDGIKYLVFTDICHTC